MRAIIIGLAILFANSNLVLAQEICGQLLKFGIFDQYNNYNDEQRFQLSKQLLCYDGVETFSDAQKKSTDIGFSIPDTLDFVFGGKSDEKSFVEKRKKFCDLDFQTASSSSTTIAGIRKASETIVRGFGDCVVTMSRLAGLHGIVQQTANKSAFIIKLSYRDGGASDYQIEGISARPATIECDRNAHLASKGNPIELNGTVEISCTNKTPERSFILSVNTNRGPISGPKDAGLRMIGLDETIDDLNRRLKAVEGRIVPDGFVGLFLNECPTGWGEYIPLRGRYVVGAPENPLSVQKTQGQPLNDQENRAVGQHLHGFTDFVLADRIHANRPDLKSIEGIGGGAQWDSGAAIRVYQQERSTHNSAGGVGTNAPYIQLRACFKG